MIAEGECSLGIELGSTRIKGILITPDTKPVASGSFDWENRNEGGVWIYTLDDILTGINACYQSLKADVKKKYGIKLAKLKNMGVSAMMHGYMAFDKNDNLLTPFRTWRNTMTAAESEELSELFSYPIPQRWTISHLLKDIKERKEYLGNLDHVMTLAAYVHYLLTGEKKIGIGGKTFQRKPEGGGKVGFFPFALGVLNVFVDPGLVLIEPSAFPGGKIFQLKRDPVPDGGLLARGGEQMLVTAGGVA